MNVLHSFQYLGYAIPPQADRGTDRRWTPGTSTWIQDLVRQRASMVCRTAVTAAP